MTDIIYNIILGGITISYCWLFLNKKMFQLFLGAAGYGALALALAYINAENGFHLVRLLCWWLFIHCPVVLLWYYVQNKKKRKKWAWLSLVKLFLLLAIGVDAFFIEPQWVEITEYEITTPKITKPVKIAVLADIQTDDIGQYEKEVLLKTQDQSPDIVLLCGDYIQQQDEELRERQYKKMNDILHDVKLRPPLGAYAVGGDFDPPGWTNAFKRTKVHCFENTGTKQTGEVYLTGLNLAKSFDTTYTIGERENFHIVFGHGPDFALGNNQADLLIAGHTHGGQVQLPFIGPLITLSKIPKEWADTMTKIKENQHLVVTKGIGTERGLAPKIRFMCRPEIVMISLLPK